MARERKGAHTTGSPPAANAVLKAAATRASIPPRGKARASGGTARDSATASISRLPMVACTACGALLEHASSRVARKTKPVV